jgi:glycosyltransferase involved in cell wall biosynthesis
MLPLVSICIPCYKQIEFLKRNLDAVVAQTFTDFEVIITDDTPDDSVEKLVNAYKEKLGDKLKYFRNKISLGSPENWNECVRKASGKYIKIMHHDDWFSSPESLGAFVKLMQENPNTSLGFCATDILEVKSGKKRQHSPTSEQLSQLKAEPEILFFGNFIGPPSSIIYEKSLNIEFDKKTKYVVDVDFYIRAFQKNKNFAYTPATLITNTAEQETQVTAQSLNSVTQLGEYSYLFNKLNHSFIPAKKYLSFFKSLFLKYNVKDISFFRQNNIPAPQPTIIFSLLITYLKAKKLYKK